MSAWKRFSFYFAKNCPKFGINLHYNHLIYQIAQAHDKLEESFRNEVFKPTRGQWNVSNEQFRNFARRLAGFARFNQVVERANIFTEICKSSMVRFCCWSWSPSFYFCSFLSWIKTLIFEKLLSRFIRVDLTVMGSSLALPQPPKSWRCLKWRILKARFQAYTCPPSEFLSRASYRQFVGIHT